MAKAIKKVPALFPGKMLSRAKSREAP